MSTKKPAAPLPVVTTPNVTQETLEATPERVTKFLRGVGTVPAIRAALAGLGYTDAEHAEGWSLLHAASGYSHSSDFATATDPLVHDAVAALDAWDEDGFRTVRATLNRYPAQSATVLAGIGPSTGAAAVLGVKTLLDRIDALAKSKDAHDIAASKALVTRGITAAVHTKLRGLIATAEKGAAPATDDDAAAQAKAAAAHQAALVQLRAWYEEWSELARVAIKRRDRLLRLGLGKRKVSKKGSKTPSNPVSGTPVAPTSAAKLPT